MKSCLSTILADLFPLWQKKDQMGKRKETKTLSMTKINLAAHAEDDGTDPVSAEFKFKKSKHPAVFVVLFFL